MATATTEGLSPPAVVNLVDDDDEISLIYATPPTVSRRNKRNTDKNGTNIKNPISVEHYSNHINVEHHHHSVVLNSPSSRRKRTRTKTKTKTSPITIDLSGDDSLFSPKSLDRYSQNTDDDVQFIRSVSKHGGGGSHPSISITEPGETSNSNSSPHNVPTFVCEICVEPTPYTAAFFIMGGCTHSYCSDCMVRYVASKLQDNITQIRCPAPSCPGLLEPDHCRSLLPKEVFDRWGNALCEAVLLASQKYYCPFKDCSALLFIDGDEEMTITESDCPNCQRLFCVKCKVPWHVGIKCEEFQKLNKDEREKEDIMLMQLAKKKNWIRCPKCRFYVEKSQGCLFMRCRCGYTFCYNCGAPLTNHYCTKCKH